jgi:hypothetical protein
MRMTAAFLLANGLAAASANAAPLCATATLTGWWSLQVVETEIIYPREGGYREETSHVSCDMLLEPDAPGRLLATVECSGGPYTSSAVEDPEQYILVKAREPGLCRWIMSAVLDDFGQPVVGGTGDNVLDVSPDRDSFVGGGRVAIGIGNSRWPAPNWEQFSVTLAGIKRASDD